MSTLLPYGTSQSLSPLLLLASSATYALPFNPDPQALGKNTGLGQHPEVPWVS